MFNQTYEVSKDDFANAGKVSSNVKALLKQIGIPSEVLRRIAVACYEAEINMIIHSDGGQIVLDIDESGQIVLKFIDKGPGIKDLDKALTAGWSTASAQAREFGFGAGMGLPNMKRVSDEFDIQTSPKGTLLTLGFKV